MAKMSKDVDLCSQLLIVWLTHERENKDMTIHDEELAKTFIYQVIHKKFDVFGIDVVLPDELLAIITICTNSNPGQSQIVLKYLLDDIKKRKGPIPKGYVVTTEDFTFAFPTRFPILHEFKDLNEQFQKLWDAQKKEKTHAFDNDNKCDTPEWWLEVMEE
jgi:hypothetical protein